MLANINKKKLSLAVIAATSTMLTAPVATASERAELTMVPKFFPTFVRNFNPFLETQLDTVQDFIYEPLVVFNELQGNKPVMRLATDYYMSDDLKQVTFEIRKGVKWSDGKPFSAEDVAYTFNLLKKHPELDRTGINVRLKSIKAAGNKVVFDLTEANSNVPYLINEVSVVAKHVWSKVGDPTRFTNENPVGTGPFTQIDTFTPQLYTQCRNPNYWDNDNLDVDCLRLPQIAGNDQFLGQVLSGKFDWTYSFIPDVDSTYAAASPDNKYWYPAGGTQAFMLNYKSPKDGNREAINNIDFRRAFSMAIDRETIIDIAFYGGGVLNDYASGLGKAFAAWSDDKVYNQYKPFMTYNVANAKALLKKAGFKDTDGDGFVETPTGKQISLTIQSPNGWTDFNNTVQLGVEMLQEVGIQAKASTPDFSVYNQAMLDASYDVAYTNYFHGADPYTYWDSGYHSRFQANEGMPRFALHYWTNAELDKLLNGFYKTADRDEQLKIAHKVQKIIAENQVTIPVMSGAYTSQYNTARFTGWWNEKNPKGRPMPITNTQERLLQVLDLKPKA
ncbi:ABC transporter substrate-binding protein [Photobacterium sp. TY1-4]|uniref:ABC transporter substrate-binding protein n=1 Tax=Photobacterium sp. TY1-4 TaxID=2899122 RepID=UPI0021BE900E|nr:ABC transporter substrate-binding protein [Photobacterium sp. TY1-4]UXI00895.1 ABC transporter substrate-binding protein [Photobacterium sp. TY1-4]